MPVMIAPNGYSKNVSEASMADYLAKGWVAAKGSTSGSSITGSASSPAWLKDLIARPETGAPAAGTISESATAPALAAGTPFSFDTSGIANVSAQYKKMTSPEYLRKMASQALGASSAQTNSAIQQYARSTGQGAATAGGAARAALLRTVGGAAGYLAGEQARQSALTQGLSGMLGAEQTRFGAESGVAQLNETQRQFDAGYGLDASKLSLSADQLREQQRQFDSNWLLQSRGQGLDWLSKLLSMA